jgi:hypothetical protein
MYHTQENRGTVLTKAISCTRTDAWLGEGSYFWHDRADADTWGKLSKKDTGIFDVYKAKIDSEFILDTVFNEEHYFFWLKAVERVAGEIKRITGYKATLKDVNQYFLDKGQWDEMDGILFQDLPSSNEKTLVKGFFYRKRIQLVVYNDDIIKSFDLVKSSKIT